VVLEALSKAQEVDEGVRRALADRSRRRLEDHRLRRVREDALGEVGHGKVESLGSPHCARRDIIT
jgi:hypothetical protein